MTLTLGEALWLLPFNLSFHKDITMKKILPIATLIAASVSLSAFANSGHSMHMSSSTTNEMQKELNQSMDKMHSDMAKSMNEQMQMSPLLKA